jgi:ABC-type Fe3+ transport system permease subunit
MNLISRMGWSSVLVEGRGVLSWSLSEVVAAFGHVADFRTEFGWSLQLSLWTVGLSLVLTASMIPWSGNRYRAAWFFGVLGCMLATPGPLINLLIGQFLNRCLPDSWSFLSDQTLLGPILALQFRVLPVVFGLIWVAQQQYLHRYGELLALEAGLPYRKRFYAWMRFVQRGWIIAFWIGFSIAFGDLASYLLVQPPGVTTVAMRMFDLLHYGTKNREAGLAVVLAFFGALSSIAWLRVSRRGPISDRS